MSKLDSERGNFLEEESGGSFSDSDSEPEIPALPGVVEKKRSRSSGSTRHCDSKRSRMSRIRGGVDKVLATLNKDDDFEDFTRNKRDKSSVENQRTPHTSQRSRSAPGSSTSIKTPARTVKKVATSRSAMTNKGAHKSSLDKTPNRFKGTPPKLAESNDELDLGDGVDDHPEDLPSVPSSRSTSPTPPQTPTLHTQPNVSTALKEITSLLNTVVKRMDRMENELKQHSTSVSSSSASEGNKKSKKSSPPLIVAVSCLELCVLI